MSTEERISQFQAKVVGPTLESLPGDRDLDKIQKAFAEIALTQ